jgi:hypothetical protein
MGGSERQQLRKTLRPRFVPFPATLDFLIQSQAPDLNATTLAVAN